MCFEVNSHMYPHYYLLTNGIYPPNGLYLYEQFMAPKERNEKSMPRCRRFQTKMWRIVLVFYNQIGESFKIQVVNGT